MNIVLLRWLDSLFSQYIIHINTFDLYTHNHQSLQNRKTTKHRSTFESVLSVDSTFTKVFIQGCATSLDVESGLESTYVAEDFYFVFYLYCHLYCLSVVLCPILIG